MPGIVGIIYKSAPQNAEGFIHAMLEVMRHEADYKSGMCSAPELGIYAGWISHQDSFAVTQSGPSHDEMVDIVFSGEIFEDEPYPVQLGRKRITRLYQQKGESFVSELNGLFSGLLIDRRNRRAILFNDRYGLDRIYLHESPRALYFASEAKALLRVIPETREFDSDGLRDLFSYGCTLEGRTFFRGIKTLPPASIWSFSASGGLAKSTYFSTEKWEYQSPISEEEFNDEFLQLFPRVYKRYLRSEVPLGVSLTGGLDSRMLMACWPSSSPAPKCYTYSGTTENTLDVKIAARVAAACGASHNTIRIGNDFLSTFQHQVDRTVYITDGCSGATGSHEIYFNKIGRTYSPVRLTGNFGSEILRSVSTFKPVGLNPELFSAAFRPHAISTSPIGESAVHPVTFSAFREIPWSLFGPLAAGRSQITFRTPYLDNEIVALAYRAPMSARTSPVPALSFIERVHPDLARIPTDRGQIGTTRSIAWALRRAYAEVTFKLDYLRTEGMPKGLGKLDPLLRVFEPMGLMGLHKFLPYRNWFRGPLRSYVEDVLNDPRTLGLPYWNAKYLKAMLNDHLTGRSNRVREINLVITVAAMDRLLLHASPSDSIS